MTSNPFKRKNTMQMPFYDESNFQQTIHQEKGFYEELFESSQVLQIRICDLEITPKTFLSASYALYVIEIVTEKFSYQTKKRFNEFLQLYEELNKKFNFNFPFPSRTIFQSGADKKITQKRTEIFNKFMHEVFTQRKIYSGPYIQLLKFLQVKNEYERRNLISSQKLMKNHPNDGLTHQILKINISTEETIKILKKIEEIIGEQSAKKKKIKIEDIKVLFFGFDGKKGLIQLALTSQNDLVGLKILKTLNLWLDVETNHCYDNFLKVFLMAPPNAFTLRHDFQENEEFMKQYFIFLNKYLEKGDYKPQTTLNQKYLEMYLLWKKKISESKFQTKEIYHLQDKLSPKNEEEQNPKYENFLQNILFFRQDYEIIKFKKQEGLEVGIGRSENRKMMNIYVMCDRENREKWRQILQTQSWNPLLKDTIGNSYTNIIKQTYKIGKKHEKILRFSVEEKLNSLETDRKQSTETMDQLQNDDQYEEEYKIIKKPPTQDTNSNSFYQMCELSEKKNKIEITIWMYFHKKNMKSYFQTEIEGKSFHIWERVCELVFL